MSTARIETLIWVLIYSGLLAVGLGLAVQGSADMLGFGLIVCGAVVTAIGAVLIWVRSRMRSGGDS